MHTLSETQKVLTIIPDHACVSSIPGVTSDNGGSGMIREGCGFLRAGVKMSVY